MKITDMPPMETNEDMSPINPFLQDLFHMGTKVGKNVTIMHRNHSENDCPYLIIIDTITGERKRIDF